MKDFLYEDIINLPHHKSSSRKPMSIINRAAQFAPFAALAGYDDAVKETARLTDDRIELDDYAKDELNRRLLYLAAHADEELVSSITYFVPDNKKSGGEYVSHSGIVTKIKEFENVVIMDDGAEIPIQEIVLVEGNMFCE